MTLELSKDNQNFEKNRVRHATLDSFPPRQDVSEEVGGDGKRCEFKILHEELCQFGRSVQLEWIFYWFATGHFLIDIRGYCYISSMGRSCQFCGLKYLIVLRGWSPFC